MGVVHEEQTDSIILQEIANRDILTVAAVIGKAERPCVQYFDKPCWAAPVLDVGPVGLTHRGHVEAVSYHDEVGLIGTQLTVVMVANFQSGVGFATAQLLLHRFDAGRESNLTEFVTHTAVSILRGNESSLDRVMQCGYVFSQ